MCGLTELHRYLPRVLFIIHLVLIIPQMIILLIIEEDLRVDHQYLMALLVLVKVSLYL